MTAARVLVLAALMLLSGCRDAPAVLVDDATTELRGNSPTTVTATGGSPTQALDLPARPSNMPPRVMGDPSLPAGPPPAGDHWWPTDMAAFNEAFERCGQPDSPWRPAECAFIGGLFLGTHETYGKIITDHGVDLLGAGRSMCDQMDRAPDPEQFAANIVPPDGWPAEMDPGPAVPLGAKLRFELAYIAVIASQTLCDQHGEIGAWLMTPREAEPTAGPST